MGENYGYYHFSLWCYLPSITLWVRVASGRGCGKGIQMRHLLEERSVFCQLQRQQVHQWKCLRFSGLTQASLWRWLLYLQPPVRSSQRYIYPPRKDGCLPTSTTLTQVTRWSLQCCWELPISMRQTAWKKKKGPFHIIQYSTESGYSKCLNNELFPVYRSEIIPVNLEYNLSQFLHNYTLAPVKLAFC